MHTGLSGVVLFMYKKPTETKAAIEGGSIIGIGEFLLVRNRGGKERTVWQEGSS